MASPCSAANGIASIITSPITEDTAPMLGVMPAGNSLANPPKRSLTICRAR